MKKKIAIALVSGIAVGIFVYLIQKDKMEKRKLVHVSDAGYETAHDVLYPMKKWRWKKI